MSVCVGPVDMSECAIQLHTGNLMSKQADHEEHVETIFEPADYHHDHRHINGGPYLHVQGDVACAGVPLTWLVSENRAPVPLKPLDQVGKSGNVH